MTELWAYIRDTFPPARVVAFLVPILAPFIAIFCGWAADHLPFLADQLTPDAVTAFVIAVLLGIVGLAYKWLDGRAKWETSQINAHVALAQANKLGETSVTEILEAPPEPRRRRRK